MPGRGDPPLYQHRGRDCSRARRRSWRSGQSQPRRGFPLRVEAEAGDVGPFARRAAVGGDEDVRRRAHRLPHVRAQVHGFRQAAGAQRPPVQNRRRARLFRPLSRPKQEPICSAS